VLVALLGYIDSFFRALDDAETVTAAEHPDRLEIDLDRFYAVEGDEVQAIFADESLAAYESRIRLGAALIGGGEEIDVLLELISMDSNVWVPAVADGELPGREPGIVISETAARDLGVRVGDTLLVRHPVRAEDGSFTFAESAMPVVATHRHPIRIYAYADRSQAALFGLEGSTNRISALPARGDVPAARSALFELPGVASVQEAAASSRLLRERMDQFVGVLYFMEGALLILAALIAYNPASISLDERSREHATMLAYGVRSRTVMRVAVVEGLALGALSTVLGFIGGLLLTRWFVDVLARRVMPDIGFEVAFSPQSFLIVFVLGVLAAGLTPLFGWRRLRRMNVPSTLRLME
jgi:putative ABC transport system permease protein